MKNMFKNKKKFKLNKKLLFELLMAETPYGEEEIVVKIIERELKKLGFTYYVDKVGNVVAQRGNAQRYPLLNAHMDIVDLSYSYFSYGFSKSYYTDKYFGGYSEVDELIDTLGPELLSECVNCKDCISYNQCIGYEGEDILGPDINNLCEHFTPSYLAEKEILKWAERNGLSDYYEDYYEGYIDTSKYEIVEKDGKISGKGKSRVLGGDDKCGIFLALEIARATDIPMKLLFTVGEEVGCIGIKHFVITNPEWFKDVSYSITIDRKDGDNLLSSQLGVRSCTKRFAANLAVAGIMEGIPVKIKDGSVADVIYIRELVKDSVNISAGYHNAHGEDEYIIWSEVEGIFKWVKRFVEEN